MHNLTYFVGGPDVVIILTGNGTASKNRYHSSLNFYALPLTQLYCAKDYYGIGCETFCTEYGNFQCSSDGVLGCKPGWGPAGNCTQRESYIIYIETVERILASPVVTSVPLRLSIACRQVSSTLIFLHLKQIYPVGLGWSELTLFTLPHYRRNLYRFLLTFHRFVLSFAQLWICFLFAFRGIPGQIRPTYTSTSPKSLIFG